MLNNKRRGNRRPEPSTAAGLDDYLRERAEEEESLRWDRHYELAWEEELLEAEAEAEIEAEEERQMLLYFARHGPSPDYVPVQLYSRPMTVRV